MVCTSQVCIMTLSPISCKTGTINTVPVVQRTFKNNSLLCKQHTTVMLPFGM